MRVNTHKVVWLSRNPKFTETEIGVKAESYEIADQIAQKLNTETADTAGKYVVRLIKFMTKTGMVTDEICWDLEHGNGSLIKAVEAGKFVVAVRDQTRSDIENRYGYRWVEEK